MVRVGVGEGPASSTEDAAAGGWRKEPTAIPLPNAPNPEAALAAIGALPYPALLRSATAPDSRSGYSYLCAIPSRVLQLGPLGVQRFVHREGGIHGEVLSLSPFDALEGELALHEGLALPSLPPFQGGAVGYLGYEMGSHLEPLWVPAGSGPGLPQMHMAFYPEVVAWDHAKGTCWYFSRRREEPGPLLDALRGHEADTLNDLGSWPSLSGKAMGPHPSYPVPGLPGIRSTISRDSYLEKVEQVRQLILEGEIFQANLTQAFHREWKGDSIALFSHLVEHYPAPFAAYLRLAGTEPGAAAVVSTSPESFLRVTGRPGPQVVRTRPIKGTAPRALDAATDARNARALQSSEKDRSENVMIVDLLRNDLSRVCEDASVVVTELCQLESHPSVHHLVSTIQGVLHQHAGVVDLLRATFPCGSITGAPKLRAMEILTQMEPTAREVYTGALGWLGCDGAAELSVAIRTITLREGVAWFPAGGGVVLESDPMAEYDETVAKVRGILNALEATA